MLISLLKLVDVNGDFAKTSGKEQQQPGSITYFPGYLAGQLKGGKICFHSRFQRSSSPSQGTDIIVPVKAGQSSQQQEYVGRLLPSRHTSSLRRLMRTGAILQPSKAISSDLLLPVRPSPMLSPAKE